MREDVQAEVAALWEQATTENLNEIGDLKGYASDFFHLFGFESENVDYKLDVNEIVEAPGLV